MYTYIDILKNVCILAGEEVPSSLSSPASYIVRMRNCIRHALEEVCTAFDFGFRERTMNIVLPQGVDSVKIPACIAKVMKNGIFIQEKQKGLYFVENIPLDIKGTGAPSYYTIFSDSIVFDKQADMEYTLEIKYYTALFAMDNLGAEKSNLENADDVTIIPDYFVKTLEWGAFMLYRQNYKPDQKFENARQTYTKLLFDMQKQALNCQKRDSKFVVG